MWIFRGALKYLLPSIAWLMLCAVGPAFASSPSSVHATYDVYKDSLKIGQIEETYTRDNNRYTLTSTTTPLGLLAVFKPEKVNASSSGSIGENGLQPLRFSYLRGRDESKGNHAEFDWDAKQLTLIDQSQRTVAALPDGTQDRLSAMYQFMFLTLQISATLDFPMTNGRKLDNYHYIVINNQKIQTPAGEFDTLYLDNQAKAGETRNEIWLATQHNNLPCKMTITDANGDQLTQVLSKLDIKP